MSEAAASDADLVGRARKGDLCAFNEIVCRHQARVRHAACGATRSAADVDDIVQEVFLAAYLGLEHLRDPDKLGPWLVSVTRRTCSNWRRRQGTRAATETATATGTMIGSPGPHPDEQLVATEVARQIRGAVASLPPSTAAAVSLYYLDGYTYDDIAMALSVPITTVKGRLQMGREMLGKELAKLMDADFSVTELLAQAHETARATRYAVAWEKGIQRPREIVERALERAAALPAGRERDLARVHALMGKVQYLPNADRGARTRLRREALELARKHREHRMVGDLLVESALFDQPPVPEPERLFAQAIGEYGKAGDRAGEGVARYWLASQLLRSHHTARARDELKTARPMLLEGRRYQWAAVADAALELTDRIGTGHRLASLPSYLWVCEGLNREADGVVRHVAQPGCGGGLLHGHLVSDVALDGVVMDPTRRAGDQWTVESMSFGTHPLRTTLSVLSDDEELTVPAGTFRGCRHVRSETVDPRPDAESSEQAARTNRHRLGTRDTWFARGVGIVKVQVDTEMAHDDPPVFALAQVHVARPASDWLPLAVGNRWEYCRENLPSADYAAADLLEVRYRDDGGVFYLSHSGYAHLIGAAAERAACAEETRRLQ